VKKCLFFHLRSLLVSAKKEKKGEIESKLLPLIGGC